MTVFVNFFEKMSSFWQFFDIQMAIFRRVRSAVKSLDNVHYHINTYPGVRIITVLNAWIFRHDKLIN